MLEEQRMLPITSKACYGLGLRIPSLKLVESQNKLELEPRELDPYPNGINPY